MPPKKKGKVRVKWLHAHMGREVGVPMDEDRDVAERFKKCEGLEILNDNSPLEKLEEKETP